MKRIFAFAMTGMILLLIACAEQSDQSNAWEQAVNTYEDSPSEQAAQVVFEQIEPDPWKESTTVNLEERMNTAYEIALEEDMKDKARQYIRALVLFTNSASKRSVYLKKLTEVYDETEDEHQISYYINLAMNDKPASLDSSINRLGRNLYDSARHRMNSKKARQFVDACEAYALTHPDDPKSADYLQSAAETARSLEEFDRSIFYYTWVYNEFPDHKKRPLALFLTGFTYDDDLGMYDSARVYYDSFINKYPDHDLSDDAQFLLDNLGKSEDEIMKSLEKGTQKQQ